MSHVLSTSTERRPIAIEGDKSKQIKDNKEIKTTVLGFNIFKIILAN
jgi:hypothetical protein